MFNRSSFFGKEILPCYGIGEVSTDPAYRGQGLARTCMDDALARIDAGPAKISSLSAAAGVEKFYASFGYVAFPIRYTKMNFALTASPAAPLGAAFAAQEPEASESPMARRIRMLAGSMSAAASSLSSAAASALGATSAPPAPVTTPPAPAASGQYQVQLNGTNLQIRKVDVTAYAFELSMLYDAYNVGFVGPIARSHAYWRQFVPHKLKGGFWGAFEANPSAATQPDSTSPPFTTLVAYVGVAEKRGTVKVAEYAASKQWQSNAQLFQTLTQIACLENPAVAALASSGSGSGPSVTAVVPMAPLTRLEGVSAEADEKLTDDSWMYRIRPDLETPPPVSAASAGGKRRPRGLQPWAVHEEVRKAAAANQHVMWFTDAF